VANTIIIPATSKSFFIMVINSSLFCELSPKTQVERKAISAGIGKTLTLFRKPEHLHGQAQECSAG
jgi:hypothetical protein